MGVIAGFGEVLAEMGAAGFGAGQRRRRDRLADRDQAVEVEPVLPRQIERRRLAAKARAGERAAEFVERRDRALQTASIADDADVLPHQIVKPLAQVIEVAGGSRKRPAGAGNRFIDRHPIGIAKAALVRRPAGHGNAGEAAIDGGVRHPVAAEPVGAVHAAGVLAGGEQAGQPGRAVGLEAHPAHQVMGGRHHLDPPAGEIEAAIGAALHHALELGAHPIGAEMAHVDVDPAARRRVALAHLLVDGAGDDVPRRPFRRRAVTSHEALTVAAE